jgi:hypothetical protein
MFISHDPVGALGSIEDQSQSDVNQQGRTKAKQGCSDEEDADDGGINSGPIGKAGAYTPDFLICAVEHQFGHFTFTPIQWFDCWIAAHYAMPTLIAGATLRPTVMKAQKRAAATEKIWLRNWAFISIFL